MFRLNRNERSHWSGNGVHVESELVFMIGRNMHLAMVERLARLDHLVKASKQLVLAEADSSPTGAFKDAIDWVIKETKELG